MPQDWGLSRPQMTDLARSRAERLRSALGLAEQDYARAVTLTPACGLAGATPAQAKTAMDAVADAARSVCGETMPAGEFREAGDGDGGL